MPKVLNTHEELVVQFETEYKNRFGKMPRGDRGPTIQHIDLFMERHNLDEETMCNWISLLVDQIFIPGEFEGGYGALTSDTVYGNHSNKLTLSAKAVENIETQREEDRMAARKYWEAVRHRRQNEQDRTRQEGSPPFDPVCKTECTYSADCKHCADWWKDRVKLSVRDRRTFDNMVSVFLDTTCPGWHKHKE